jgi:predicted RNase H-like HicB family nuclease
MKAYYAVFKVTNEIVEVYFPDLKGCVTFGDNMEEAINMAEDVLSGYLEVSEKKYIKKPSSYNAIYEKYGNKTDVSIHKINVNPVIMDAYKIGIKI